MPITTPDWVKDAVFYQIFPDRFARSARVTKPGNLEPWDSPPTVHGFKGGDLLGVAEHLDYLQDLGINAIYFNPIFASASNHRYHTHDYYQVDPLLGGNDAFRELLDACHVRGIRVVIDGVFNHASRGFFMFNHLLECGPDSPYVDWFTVKSWPLNAYDPAVMAGKTPPNYAAWVGLPALPEFNTDNPQVREYIFAVAAHWIRFGADGWRLDVPFEIDDDAFWQEFRRRVKAANPDAYIVGELWGESRRWLGGDQFDAQMNYLFQRPAIGFFGARTLSDLNPGGGFERVHPLDAAGFAAAIEYALGLYDWQITLAQLTMLGSHDTPRLATMVGEDHSALKLAMLCMLTMPGAPNIYCGDELALPGGYDPACRNPMPWETLDAHKGDWFGYIRAAIALRNAHPVLRRGTYSTVYAEGQQYAYLRELNGARALVAFNVDRAPAGLDLQVGGFGQVVFGEASGVELSAGATRLTLPARGGVVLL